jgi:hypothetical protein
MKVGREKQRHISKRIFERLRDEHGYSGGGILLATNPRQPLGYVRGLELSPADIIVYGVGSVGHNRSPAAFEWGSMALMQEDIAAAGEALIGRELTAPSFTQRIRPPAPLPSRCPASVEFTGYLLDFRRVCPGATPDRRGPPHSRADSSHKPLN